MSRLLLRAVPNAGVQPLICAPSSSASSRMPDTVKYFDSAFSAATIFWPLLVPIFSQSSARRTF